MKWLVVLPVVLSVLLGCKKEFQNIPAEVMNVGNDHWVNDVLFLNDSVGLAVGGVKTVEGWVCHTTDGGKTWSSLDLGYPVTASAISQDSSGKLWIGSELLYLHRSDDMGAHWEFIWLQDEQPTHLLNRPMIRDFGFSGPDEIWFVGGENYNTGVLYHSTDGGLHWDYLPWEYQLNDWSNSGNYKAIAGHGLVLFSDGDMDWKVVLDKGNFTGVHVYSDGRMVVVSQEGNIYLSPQVGDDFERVCKAQGCLAGYSSLIESDGNLVAVGFRGRVSVSDDRGESWQHFYLSDYPNLYSLTVLDGQFFCGSDQGRIFHFSLPH